MRFAILSDIHSNWKPSKRCWLMLRRKAAQLRLPRDIVGYNANPCECIKVIRALECPVVKGNHDEQVSIVRSTEGFNELAEEAIDWTRAQLSDDDKAWLADLRLTRQCRDFPIVHAPLDTPGQWGYVSNDLDALASFTYQHTSLCFFGHTHWPTAFVRDDNVRRITVGQIVLSAGKKYFLNPGSIGQPRDRDWRAAYCILHADRQVVEQRRVKYDLETAQRKIRQAGLPDRLADRLAVGR